EFFIFLRVFCAPSAVLLSLVDGCARFAGRPLQDRAKLSMVTKRGADAQTPRNVSMAKQVAPKDHLASITEIAAWLRELHGRASASTEQRGRYQRLLENAESLRALLEAGRPKGS